MKCEHLELLPGGKIKIPGEYLLELGIKDQLICCLEDGQLIIRPFYDGLKPESKNLLDSLREKGFQGEELLNEYKKIKRASKP